MKALLMEVLTRSFRPEFINRIDETVVFHPLGSDQIKSIAAIQLQRLYKRLEERGYQVHMSEAALEHISKAGYDPIFGARPLKRALQQEVENPLAQQILSGALLPGKPVELEMEDGKIVARQ